MLYLSIMVLYLFEYHGVVYVSLSWCCICFSIMVLYLFEYHGVVCLHIMLRIKVMIPLSSPEDKQVVRQLCQEICYL